MKGTHAIAAAAASHAYLLSNLGTLYLSGGMLAVVLLPLSWMVRKPALEALRRAFAGWIQQVSGGGARA